MKISFSLLAAIALINQSAFGTPPQNAAPLPFVSPIFGDNMVLQGGKPNSIWGWSQPGDGVKVEIGENSATATAAADGRWKVQIEPLAPGGPALRVFKLKPDGGFLGKPNDLHLNLGDSTVIPLSGAWKGKVSVDARPPHLLPVGFENPPTMPGVLYQGMLAPIAPVAIAGAIWYQGESNAERAYQYRRLLPAMIGDWRKLFGQGDFPFYIVSLPAYHHRSDVPVDSSWAEIREAMALTAGSVPNSCVAITIDTGDPDNIHPIDKKQVGERLALCALGEYYGRNVPRVGPTLASVERLPGALKLNFNHTDGGLVVKGDKLSEFSLAGDGRQWFWAEARIDCDAVIVSSPSVPDPKKVRYAWQDNPGATLFNGAGLPAAPFRTDDWKGVTEGAH